MTGTTVAPSEPGCALRRRSRWRWAAHLALLSAFPLFVAFTAAREGPRSGPILPTTATGLLQSAAVDLLFFTAFLAAACLVSRPRREDFLLAWRGGLRPVGLGFLWSLALRAVLAVLALAALLIVDRLGGDASKAALRPQVENLVDWKALRDPVYLALALTLVSFVLGGLREELWRVGMIAGVRALFPARLRGVRVDALAVVGSALLFGLGHLSQGWMGVGLTTAIGLLLGALIVARRSIWEAVFAHGFFDAATFVLLRFAGEFLERLRG